MGLARVQRGVERYGDWCAPREPGTGASSSTSRPPRWTPGGLARTLARAIAKVLAGEYAGVQRDRTHSFTPEPQYFTLCQIPASS
jgi:hypothetical protein